MTDISDIKTVTVLGAGMMGPGLAQIFAAKGYNTIVWSPIPEELPECMDAIRKNLEGRTDK